MLALAGFPIQESFLVTLVRSYGITAPNLAAKKTKIVKFGKGRSTIANTYSLEETGEHIQHCFANLK